MSDIHLPVGSAYSPPINSGEQTAAQPPAGNVMQQKINSLQSQLIADAKPAANSATASTASTEAPHGTESKTGFGFPKNEEGRDPEAVGTMMIYSDTMSQEQLQKLFADAEKTGDTKPVENAIDEHQIKIGLFFSAISVFVGGANYINYNKTPNMSPEQMRALTMRALGIHAAQTPREFALGFVVKGSEKDTVIDELRNRAISSTVALGTTELAGRVSPKLAYPRSMQVGIIALPFLLYPGDKAIQALDDRGVFGQRVEMQDGSERLPVLNNIALHAVKGTHLGGVVGMTFGGLQKWRNSFGFVPDYGKPLQIRPEAVKPPTVNNANMPNRKVGFTIDTAGVKSIQSTSPGGHPTTPKVSSGQPAKFTVGPKGPFAQTITKGTFPVKGQPANFPVKVPNLNINVTKPDFIAGGSEWVTRAPSTSPGGHPTVPKPAQGQLLYPNTFTVGSKKFLSETDHLIEQLLKLRNISDSGNIRLAGYGSPQGSLLDRPSLRSPGAHPTVPKPTPGYQSPPTKITVTPKGHFTHAINQGAFALKGQPAQFPVKVPKLKMAFPTLQQVSNISWAQMGASAFRMARPVALQYLLAAALDPAYAKPPGEAGNSENLIYAIGNGILSTIQGAGDVYNPFGGSKRQQYDFSTFEKSMGSIGSWAASIFTEDTHNTFERLAERLQQAKNSPVKTDDPGWSKADHATRILLNGLDILGDVAVMGYDAIQGDGVKDHQLNSIKQNAGRIGESFKGLVSSDPELPRLDDDPEFPVNPDAPGESPSNGPGSEPGSSPTNNGPIDSNDGPIGSNPAIDSGSNGNAPGSGPSTSPGGVDGPAASIGDPAASQIKLISYKGLSTDIQTILPQETFMQLSDQQMKLLPKLYNTYMNLHPKVADFPFSQFVKFDPMTISTLKVNSAEFKANEVGVKADLTIAQAEGLRADAIQKYTQQLKQVTQSIQSDTQAKLNDSKALQQQIAQQDQARRQRAANAANLGNGVRSNASTAQIAGSNPVATEGPFITGSVDAGAQVFSDNHPAVAGEMVSVKGKSGDLVRAYGKLTDSVPLYMVRKDGASGERTLNVVIDTPELGLTLMPVPKSIYTVAPGTPTTTLDISTRQWHNLPVINAQQKSAINTFAGISAPEMTVPSAKPGTVIPNPVPVIGNPSGPAPAPVKVPAAPMPVPVP